MEIVLVRHTSVNVQKGVCYGQTDVPLKASWKEEFEEIRNKLEVFYPAEIYSSPLLRCRQLATYLNQKVNVDDRLMELDFGRWEMKEWNSIPAIELDPWMRNFVIETVPEGESYLQLFNRATSFVHSLATLKHDRIIVITHAGIIRALLAHFDHVPLENSFANKFVFGQIVIRTV